MEISTIKEELAKGARAFKAFEKGVECVAALEGLAQFEKETSARLEKLRAEEAKITSSLEEKKASVAQIVSNAEAKAVAIREAALDKANVQAQNIMQKAEAYKESILNSVKPKEIELAKMSQALEEKQGQFDIISKDLLALQKQKDDVLAKLRSIIA